MSTTARARTALLGLVALVAVTVSCGSPPQPGFYQPPANLSGRPGDVIATVETNFGLNGDVRSTAIKYRSTSATGKANYVTGTLLVPKAAWTGGGPRPLVSFAPGTQGVGDSCAASTTMTNSTFYQQATVQSLLGKGWAVAVTDYEGIGTPGDHTYVVKDAEAHALLDIVRAAQRLSGSGIAANAPVAFWGYSQGGQAAAAAAEAEATYAPELNVVGTAAGGVPSNLASLGEYLDGPGNFWFTFLALAALGLNAAYPELHLESYLNDAGRQLLDQGRQSCLIDGLLLASGHHISDYTTTDPLAQPDWQARLAQQDLGNVAPAAPVLLYHGNTDEIIPFEQGTRLRDAWCARGARVQFSEEATDHIFGVLIDQSAWLDARFKGQPFTPTCNA
jgi:pimeloyl-ACP methyl ester carboxylesterase